MRKSRPIDLLLATGLTLQLAATGFGEIELGDPAPRESSRLDEFRPATPLRPITPIPRLAQPLNASRNADVAYTPQLGGIRAALPAEKKAANDLKGPRMARPLPTVFLPSLVNPILGGKIHHPRDEDSVTLPNPRKRIEW